MCNWRSRRWKRNKLDDGDRRRCAGDSRAVAAVLGAGPGARHHPAVPHVGPSDQQNMHSLILVHRKEAPVFAPLRRPAISNQQQTQIAQTQKLKSNIGSSLFLFFHQIWKLCKTMQQQAKACKQAAEHDIDYVSCSFFFRKTS